MMKRLNPFIVVLLFVSFKIFGQQETMYTQFMYNKLSINPALAGQEKYTTITGVIRDQWNGLPGAPKTQLLTCNLGRINNKHGIGINFKTNSIGIFRNLTFSGIYSYRFQFNEMTWLNMGVAVSGRNQVFDFTNSALIASQGLAEDQSIPKERITRNFLNLGYGAYFNLNQFFIGVSIPRLFNNDMDFDKNNEISQEVKHLNVMAGSSFKINKGLSLKTQGLLKFASNAPFDAEINISVLMEERYNGGITYRLGGGQGDIGESLDFLFGFNVIDNLFIGFSNDFTLSDLRKFENGSIELVVQFAIGKKPHKTVISNPRYF